MLIKLSIIVLAVQVASITCSDSSDKVYDLLTKKEDLADHESLTLLDELTQSKYPFETPDLETLTQLVKENSSDCSFEYYSNIEKLEIKYAKHADTIVPLLRRFRWAKFNDCKKGYEQNVEKAVLALSYEVEDKVKQVCDVNDGQFEDLYKDQVDRLVKYMRRNETNMEPKLLKDPQRFIEVFGETVEDVCLPYLDNLYNELSVYNLMLPNEDPEHRLSPEELGKALVDNVPNGHVLLWILKARMCYIVMEDVELFSESVRDALRKEAKKMRKGKSLKWFLSKMSG